MIPIDENTTSHLNNNIIFERKRLIKNNWYRYKGLMKIILLLSMITKGSS
jgi:hypothetical protein